MKRFKYMLLSMMMLFPLLAACGGGCGKKTITGDGDKDGGYGPVIDYIVKDGVTPYAVVIPENASECLKFAQDEMINFVFEATGVTLKGITDKDLVLTETSKYISIGGTKLLADSGITFDYGTLNGDGFFIKTQNRTVFMNGYNERGALYSVYDFLERFLGVRFLAYDCTHVPASGELPLYNLNLIEIPAFDMRNYRDGASSNVWCDQDFMARSRFSSSDAVTDQKHGGTVPVYTRVTDHNFRFFVPEELYRDQSKHPELYHPEFYYETPEFPWPTVCITNGITEEGHLDTSSDAPTVAKSVIEEMKKDILANPQAKYFLLEQEDGEMYCKCQRCADHETKFMRSGMLVRFCNVILEELHKDEELKGRDFNIVTFAYSYTTSAPMKPGSDTELIHPSCKADDNLVIRLAIGCNMYYGYFNNEKNPATKTVLTQWKSVAKYFWVWAYDKAFSEYLSYYPSLQCARANVAGFADFGALYLTIQSSYDMYNNWQSTLSTYVYGKLLWNPKLDAAALTEEYISLYYGDVAGGYVRELRDYYDRHYAVAAANGNLNVQMFGNYNTPEYLPLSVLEHALSIVDRAQAAVDESKLSRAEKFVLTQRLARIYVTPMYSMIRNYDQYYTNVPAAVKTEFLKRFFTYCEIGDVTHYGEGYGGDATIAKMKANYNM